MSWKVILNNVSMENIFTKSEESIISLYLEKWDSPLKYAYKTEKGSRSWEQIEIERTTKWSNFAEHDLLVNNTEVYLQELWNPSELVIFDFWSGSWDTIKGILEKLLSLWIIVHYHAFDISENIINICKKNIWTLWDKYTFDATLLDFETSNLVNILSDIRWKYNNIPVMGMLLWNTIWNFESMERVIANIIDGFRLSDRLVVWIEKIDISDDRRKENMLQTYHNQLVYDFTFSTLEYYGIYLSDGECVVIFNNKEVAIEIYFEFKKQRKIIIWEHKVNFNIWDRVKLWRSKKLNESEFAQLFLDLDLRIANMRTNEKNTFMEIMVAPKKY